MQRRTNESSQEHFSWICHTYECVSTFKLFVSWKILLLQIAMSSFPFVSIIYAIIVIVVVVINMRFVIFSLFHFTFDKWRVFLFVNDGNGCVAIVFLFFSTINGKVDSSIDNFKLKIAEREFAVTQVEK